MSNFVQLYKSTDQNAPTLTGQVNSVITLLNKCLVDGYTTASVTSITRSGTTATATLASPDTTLVTGNYVTIAGATGGDATYYNGTFQITVTDSTHVTYTMTGTPSGSATGTLTYAKAALGWTRPFSAGTNSQTYRSADSSSNQFYLQVIDNGATAGGAKECQFYGAEVMSADQAVTSGRFPTTTQASSGLCLRKSATADSTTRAWSLIGDDRTFYLITQASDGNWTMGFGYFISHKAGDGYNTFIQGSTTFNGTNSGASGGGWCTSLIGAYVNSAGIYVPRLYSQTGTAISCTLGCYSSTGSANGPAVGQVTYPNPSDSGAYVQPLFLCDASGSVRGRLPGAWSSLHSASSFNNYDTITGVTGLSGVTLTVVNVQFNGSSYNQPFDTFGPWT